MTYQLMYEDREVQAVTWASRKPWLGGPWDNEPDFLAWKSDDGFPCLMARGPTWCWNGYVIVPRSHPWAKSRPDPTVHGGITLWAETVWGDHAVGFDTAHGGDYHPAFIEATQDSPAFHEMVRDWEYRPADYVMVWCEALAFQAGKEGPAGSMPTLDQIALEE